MSSQVGAINSVTALIHKVFQQPKGDFADRLNSRITVSLLALSSVLLLSSHFMGDPINCWTPAQFTKDWSNFVNQYCYVHGTYFVSLQDELAFEESERRKVPINYYQWVPYILALQAFLFYLPRFIWKALVGMSGYDLAGAIRYVDNYWDSMKNDNASFKARVAAFETRASVYIWDGLRLARRKKSRDMSLYYTISTFLQTLNAWAQFWWLNSLLQSPHYNFWGVSIVGDLISGDDWQKTGHFPRITHCDFNMRRPASVQLDTVLCVLGLNIYYEKLFIFFWFWFFFVATVSSINCLRWIMRLVSRSSAEAVIKNYLTSQPSETKCPSTDKFFRALGPDGLFVLHQMTENLGDMPTSYLTIAMRNQTDTVLGDSEDEDEEPFIKQVSPNSSKGPKFV